MYTLSKVPWHRLKLSLVEKIEGSERKTHHTGIGVNEQDYFVDTNVTSSLSSVLIRLDDGFAWPLHSALSHHREPGGIGPTRDVSRMFWTSKNV
jgi:hypothetical protein